MREDEVELSDDQSPCLDRAYRELLEALPAAVYTTDAAGRITYYNQAAVDLAGRAPESGNDQWCVSWRLFRPDGAPLPHDECPMALALKENRPVRGEELVVERPDGARVPVMPYPTPLHDRAGNLVGAVNMLVDLTDRKQADDALRQLNGVLARRVAQSTADLKQASVRLDESEQRFRMLVEGVTDYAIFMLDPAGIVTSWNAGAERIKGYSADEILGRHFSCFYPAEDRSRDLPRRALEISREEGRCEMEGWRVRKDGRRFWASVVIDPIRDDAGTLIGFAKITRDETERRLAKERLAESAELATGIIDTALDAFVQIDETGTVLEWNTQAEAVFGWSRAEAIGSSIWRLIVAPRESERYRRRLARFLRARGAGIPGRRLQLRAQRSDGAELLVELSITALRRGEGRVVNGFIRDVTEQRALESQLRHAQKMEALGQMTGGVAHDFNNLLMAIIGNLEVLAAKLPERGSYGRYVEAALRAAWRGSGLTEQLLAFSRRQEFHPEVASIERLLRGVTMLCQKTVGEGVEIAVRVAPELWPARIDSGQLEAALLNLAANARDAMDWSGRLTITAENLLTGPKRDLELSGGDYVVVSVADTGCGMDSHVLARAFEPFFTTKEAGKGTGLGLSQVYGFAKQCGGAVAIESKKGAGTTVRLYLPRADGVAKPERIVRDLAGAQPGSATILVVEDDEDVREMIIEVVSHLGYRVLAATDGREALSVLEEDATVDLLFSDVVMPSGLSGIELGRGARRLRPELSVLLSSGYVGEGARSELVRSGFSFIPKPYRPTELAAKLSECLRAHVAAAG
jgi:PAS domain S-box-containing protein